MSLKDKLLEDYKTAMKEKDVVRKNVVGMVRAAILQFEKDNKVVLDDSGVLNVIAKEIKKRKDSLPEYIKSGRQDLIDELNREIEILNSYLPPMLSEEEIEQVVKETIEIIKPNGMKDMGKVMQEVMKKVSGRAEGKVVSEIVKKYLQQ
ncbi:GatB/YqeY domain-containing protein [Caldicellulosiruptor acetigenus I77R1B]|uniref:GatB/YqeY domain-containing protein n=2 Tax=Caldicellulosiruptor acetigenus TaxID=301953 RepID=G2PTB8_9FIRM|nr:GatB/YqeY domain-containing protein [Caldicellulosiruptor acetigenus]ADQ40758.1 GatB/YqeY domain-containing protein [Caldicellulosiruptor acetigenus I77R1B]AEM73309.1 GatB/YqeY domain-containing protein [Caldicellulosiruptor acetigenus 6A]WAM35141.1 GatB/YqeY domain-containing protein [Caldicellulosiruptor acetigenus]